MTGKITLDQWNDYLNTKTKGFNCPICGSHRWQTQLGADGNVLEAQVSDQSNTLPNAFAADDWKPGEPSLLRSLNVIRCGHCGWVAIFDRAFVLEQINGSK